MYICRKPPKLSSLANVAVASRGVQRFVTAHRQTYTCCIEAQRAYLDIIWASVSKVVHDGIVMGLLRFQVKGPCYFETLCSQVLGDVLCTCGLQVVYIFKSVRIQM